MSARRSLSVVLVSGIATACGGPSAIDPKDATAEDLHGRWVRTFEGTQRVFSFQEHVTFHPMLIDKTNVFVVYDFDDHVQFPLIMGTYRVEDGVIVQTPVWSREALGFAELRNDLLSLTPGAALSIEGGDGLPSHYDHLDECVVPVSVDGWHHYAVTPARWNSVGGVGAIPMTLALDPSGAVVATASNDVFRYGGECIPEVTSQDSLGNSWAANGGAGVHVVTGAGNTGDVVPSTYAQLSGTSPLRLDARSLPIDGREVVTVADLAGKVGIVLRAKDNALRLVRDDGTSFVTTPVTGVSAQFTPGELLDAGDGRALLVGTDYPGGNLRLMIVEETASGFSSSPVPIDTFATYVAAATENGDIWIVYAATIDPGASRQRQLHLATRRSGTWSTVPLSFGALPQILVRNGVAHIVHTTVVGLVQQAFYTRVDNGGITEWVALGSGTGGAPAQRPHLEVGNDGTLFVAMQGGLFVRGPNDNDQRTLPVTVTIRGSGRVTSTDGTIDCTQTCTVMAPVGRRLIVRATPTGAGQPSVICSGMSAGYDDADPTRCAVPVLPPNPNSGMDDAVTVTAMFP